MPRLNSFSGSALATAGTSISTGASGVDLPITLENPNPNTLSDDDSFALDYFGEAIDISDSYIIVGAYREDADGASSAYDDSGRAYIYDLNGILLRTLDNPSDFGSGGGDYFGSQVAVSDDYAVVTARQEDPPAGSNYGAVYVFDASTGNKLHTLTSPDTSAGSFGDALAISGTNIVVGQINASGGGKVHVYNASTGNLRYTIDNENAYSSTNGDQFGYSVDVSDSYIIVGAQDEDDAGGTSSGKAYIYDVSDGSLLHTLDNPNAAGTSRNDRFGQMVRITDSYAVAGVAQEDTLGSGSGSVYIFNPSTGSLIRRIDNPDSGISPASGDGFGRYVAVTDSYLLVYSRDDVLAANDQIGIVYIYDLATGDLENTLTGSSGETQYGHGVCASGNRAAFRRFINASPNIRKVEIIGVPTN